jgi:hypothetical protein
MGSAAGRWTAIVVALVSISACSSSTAASPKAVSSAPAAASPVAVSQPSPTPTSPPSVDVGLNCRVPVEQGGFLTFPGGTFVADPASAVGIPGVAREGISYSVRFRRWLPVPLAFVSPDGSHYAYARSDAGTSDVHFVDIASGSEVVLAKVTGAYWVVVGFDSEGVLMRRGDGGDNVGLWVLDVRTGSYRQIVFQGKWTVAGGAAWGWNTASDISRLYRVNLPDGFKSVWWSRGVILLGVDSKGAPFVVDGIVGTLYVVTRPEEPTVISYNGGSAADLRLGHGMGDGDSMWFSGAGAVYRYSPTTGLRRVADGAYYVAGPCI